MSGQKSSQNSKPRSNVLVQSTAKYNSEKLVNIRRIEDKVMEGLAITDFEIIENSKAEWDEKVRNHREEIEREVAEKKSRIEKQKLKESSWQLHRECKKFLEQNEKNWETRRLEREKENKKKERLEVARSKQERIRKKV